MSEQVHSECASGPWHKSSETPPPKDGRWVLGYWKEDEAVSIVKWDKVWWGNPFREIVSPDPHLWAEINMPEEKP